jgi:LemA protein
MGYYIAGIVVLILVIWLISSFNSIKRLQIRTDEAFATMDVHLKKRYDLIPNLVETVKGYAKHERETLEAVISARSSSVSAKGMDEKAHTEGQLEGALRHLFALAENYPQLKADTQFLQLSATLQTVERDIAEARTYYNAVIKQYNTKCQLFPSSIIAGIFGFKPHAYFEVSAPQERENVQVKF